MDNTFRTLKEELKKSWIWKNTACYNKQTICFWRVWAISFCWFRGRVWKESYKYV